VPGVSGCRWGPFAYNGKDVSKPRGAATGVMVSFKLTDTEQIIVKSRMISVCFFRMILVC
jgi:hypothetical protein